MTIPAGAASDEQLIARTRAGDMDAYDELYRRHVDDASRVARIVTNNSDEAQDVVAEAFTRVLTRLREGGGPDTELTPYLRTVVRRLAIDRHRSSSREGQPSDPSALEILPRSDDPMGRATDRQLVRHAFETLPERWQQVLWHTEIEGRSPASLAPALGTSPNAVAALAYRAREGLRQAYVAVNLSADVQPGCRSYAPKIPSYVRGTLSAHDTREMSAHLAQCSHCRERRDELLLLVADMRGVLWPALLLPASGAAAAAAAGAGAAGGGILAFLSPGRLGKRAKQVAAGAAVAAAVAIGASAYLLTSNDDPTDPPVSAPTSTSEPDEPDESDPPQEPDTDEAPEPEPPAEEPAVPPETEPEPEESEPPATEPPEPSEPPQTPTSEPSPTPSEPPSPSPSPSEPEEQPPFIEVQPPANPVVVAGEQVVLTVEVSGNPPPQLQWQFRDPVTDAPAAASASALRAEDEAGTDDGTATDDDTDIEDGTEAGTDDGTGTGTDDGSGTDDGTGSEAGTDDGTATDDGTGTDDDTDTDTDTDTDDGTDDEGWIDLEGETSETLVISELSPEHDGRAYRVKATNPVGTITTQPSVVSVQYPPEITAHPEDAQADEGGQATFQATAVANPEQMSVAWQFRAPGGDWVGAGTENVRRQGATSTLEVTDITAELDGYEYRAVFANEVGETATEPATLTVRWAPTITEHPRDAVATAGDDAEFTATASANPEAAWQWESAPAPDGPWEELPDSAGGPGDEASLTLPDVTLEDDGNFYRAVFTNELGTDTSDPAELTVTPAGRLEVNLPFASKILCAQPSGPTVHVADCGSTPAPIWEVPDDGTIRWADDGRCLDVAAPVDSFHPTTLSDCDGSSSQQWDIDPEKTGFQKIKNVGFDFPMCLDVKGGGVIPGNLNELIVFPCHGLPHQLFRFAPPSS